MYFLFSWFLYQITAISKTAMPLIQVLKTENFSCVSFWHKSRVLK